VRRCPRPPIPGCSGRKNERRWTKITTGTRTKKIAEYTAAYRAVWEARAARPYSEEDWLMKLDTADRALWALVKLSPAETKAIGCSLAL